MCTKFHGLEVFEKIGFRPNIHIELQQTNSLINIKHNYSTSLLADKKIRNLD